MLGALTSDLNYGGGMTEVRLDNVILSQMPSEMSWAGRGVDWSHSIEALTVSHPGSQNALAGDRLSQTPREYVSYLLTSIGPFQRAFV